MVSRLTLNFICFFQPLTSKTFFLFCLADRTISLIAIFSIKLMTIFTKLFHLIDGSNRTTIFKSVLSLGNKAKMRWINAISMFTNMVNYHSIWNIAISKVISNPMGSSKFFLKIKRAITIFIKKCFPKMTIPDLFPKGIESNYVFLMYMFHIVHYIPLRLSVK